MPNTDPLFGAEAKTVRPGAKRQGVIAIVIIVTVLAVIGVGFIAARPSSAGITLRSPQVAKVAKKTVRDILSVSGTLELATTLSVVAPERGTVLELPIAAGDTVKAGQILAVISTSDLQTSLDQQNASLQKLERSIQQAEAENAFSDKAAALDEAKSRRQLATAQADRDRVATLFSKKLASQSELDNAESNLSAAKESLDSLLLQQQKTATLARLSAQNNESDKKLLVKAIADLQDRIASCKVRATRSGVVYTLSAKQGKTIAQYEEIAVIGDPASIRATVDVPETKSSSVKPGTVATVYVGENGYPAKLTWMANYASTSSSSSTATVTAYVNFDQLPSTAVAGSTVTADLILGEVKDALVLPRGPFLTSGDYTTAYVVDGAKAVKKAVTFGTADGQTIQVLTGLNEGDTVLTGNYAEFIHLDEVKIDGTKE